jgi:hypothetical protein
VGLTHDDCVSADGDRAAEEITGEVGRFDDGKLFRRVWTALVSTEDEGRRGALWCADENGVGFDRDRVAEVIELRWVRMVQLGDLTPCVGPTCVAVKTKAAPAL